MYKPIAPQTWEIMKKRNVVFGALISMALAGSISATLAAEGGHSGGGGNSVNSRIVESYIQSVEQIDGYRDFLAPILEDLHVKLPVFYDFLQSRLTEMTWYMVPARLKPIAQEYTGLPFDSDQLAIQNTETGEVFIDAELFKNMSNEKGRHLLHELVENSVSNFYLNEIGKNWSTPLSSCHVLDAACMKVVRNTVNILSNSRNTSADQLSKALAKLDWSQDYILTADELSQKQKAEQLQKEKETKEIRENLPAYKLILDQLFAGLEPYCASVGDLGVTYSQIHTELSWQQERQLKKALIELAEKTTLIAYRGRIYYIEDAYQDGFSASDVFPLYSPLISSWIQRDMSHFFYQGRVIPSPTRAKTWKINELGENITALHDVCSNLSETKKALYKFVSGQ